MHSVVETTDYLADAKTAGMSEEERTEVILFLSENPTAGDEIRGTGGARKIRFAKRGKGKRGGYRIITFYSGIDIPVFLMSVFVKNQKSDLTQAERNELKQELKMFVEEYRKGISRYVQSRGKTH
jgi:hypothetical protein